MTIMVNHLTDLKDLPQWVCAGNDKQPYTPHTGIPAKANDPTTWGNYLDALRAKRNNPEKYIAVGFEFVKEQRITGVDLDHCIIDGHITPYAQVIIDRLNSYAECSHSDDGIHILVLGNIPDNIGPDPDGISKIEMYDCKRYFIMTGKHLPGTPETLEDRQEELTALHREVRAARQQWKTGKQEFPARNNTARLPNNGDSAYGLAALTKECQDVASVQEGGRNHRLNEAAFKLGQLVGGSELTRSTAERELYAAADHCGLPHAEIERTMRSGLEAGMKEPRTSPVDDDIYGPSASESRNNHHTIHEGRQGPDVDFILQCLGQGEYGDGLLFTQLFRGQVIYDHSEQEWYIWAGHHWELDRIRKIKHLVSGKLASVYLRAGAELNLQASQQEAKAEASGDEEEKETAKERVKKMKGLVKNLTERAFLLRQAARSKNVLYFASSNEGMGITSEVWDTDKWLLAVPNGVVDLHTGMIRPGKPTDYIRTTCPTEWKGIDAPVPRWEQFLQEIFEDRTEESRIAIVGFLQRLFGYGITGEVREQIFAVLYGEDGRNGKDTIQNALSYALGDVSGAISKDVLLDTGKIKPAGSATPHLCDLQGKRLAWANEPDKGARFNIGQIKDLSGGGKIPTRGLFERKITKIDPTHLLILLTNHKPHADANDSAFWDRLRLITFNMRYVDNPKESNERKKDPMLWKTLQAEAPGILAWLVRGCLEWQKQGLNTPQSVLNDGNKYREDEDFLQLFISECCIVKSDAKVKSSTLYETYSNWCKKGNIYLFNSTNFGLQLGKKKFEKKRLENGWHYLGIGIIDYEAEASKHERSKSENEPSLNGFEKPYMPDESASKDGLSNTAQSTDERYEPFFTKVSKNPLRESQNSELLGKTIHTVHGLQNESGVNEPVERGEVGMNGLGEEEQTIQGLSTLTMVNTIAGAALEGARQFYQQFCSRPGYHLRLKSDGQISIGVPEGVSDTEFEGIAAQVQGQGQALLKVLQDIGEKEVSA
jgi:putative DNA primase/helicase